MRKIILLLLGVALLSTTASASLNDGLIAYWNLTNLNDATSSGNTLSVTNSPSSTSGCIQGNCYAWDGDNGVRDALDAPISIYTADVSICYWLDNDNGAVGGDYDTAFRWHSANSADSITMHHTSGYGSSSRHYVNDGSNRYLYTSGSLVNDGWGHWCLVEDSSGNVARLYHNATLVNTTTSGTWVNISDGLRFVLGNRLSGAGASEELSGRLDEVGIWNKTLSLAEVSQLFNSGAGVTYPFGGLGQPNITNITCTSCGGDTTAPFTTADTTPTFTFNTNISAYCRIAGANLTYDGMGVSRQCTGGDNTESHTCTLTSQDELTDPTDYVYLRCVGTEESAETELEIELTDLDTNASTQMDVGIANSVLGGLATTYSDQQVYLRNLNNDQVMTTVDRVILFGNQRWLINYVLANESKLGLFNLTPVVYVMDMQGEPLSEIAGKVQAFINSTVS